MRNKFSEFEESERNETTFITARPRSSADDPVRFDGSIAKTGSSDELEANWEEIISTLAQAHLGEQLAIDDGQGVMGREEAAKALAESDSDHAKSDHAAHAIIEYLAEEDVLKLDGEKVIILMTGDDIQESGTSAMMNNWAATLDACVDRIETAIERVEENRKTLEKHIEKLEDTRSVETDFEQKQRELEQEMKALLAGRKPSKLDSDERSEFKRLRERYHRYEALEDGVTGNDGAGPEIESPQRLHDLIEDLQSIKEAMIQQGIDYRRTALIDDLEHSGARDMVENFTNVVAKIGAATDPSEKMEETSDDEFMEQISGVGEAAQETQIATDETATTVRDT
ncbi:hypothetical protein JCM17823_07070 [Halorubrum gandharaense]